MSKSALTVAVLAVAAATTIVGDTPAAHAPAVVPSRAAVPVDAVADVIDADGVVYRYYAGHGHRFQPLASFARLNALVSSRQARPAARLASALAARARLRGGASFWEYDFPYGGPVPWTSGFVQAVAAQALARTALLVADESHARTATRAFAALRQGLVMPLGGGIWIREYSFSDIAILNAQLQSLISLEMYAGVAQNVEASLLAGRLYAAARTLLPQFDLGCWSRYSLGGAAASGHYHAYHLDLLRRVAARHPNDAIWRTTLRDWSRCGT